MKILQVITGLQKAAGTSVFCGEVCNQLVARGHDVTLAIFNPRQKNLHPLDPRVHLVSIESIIHCSTANLQPSTFDVVHIHGLWSPILHKVSRWAQKGDVGVVWSTHGMTAPWSLHHKWWKKWLPWYLYQKWDLKRAAFVHSTVEQEAQWNAALGFKRGVVAPLGTTLPCSEEVKKVGVGVQRNVRTLLFVGRIYPVKAIDRLIEAFIVVKEKGEGEQWKLRIVGPDQAGHLSELEELVKHLCTSTPTLYPSIEFAGPKFDVELDDEYAKCDCLALVSHTENFGATVVDAMAHGKPVITGTKTPWKEVADKKCGWWVDNDVPTLAKAIGEMMVLSDAERMEMGARGRKLVEEKYTWQAVAKKLEWAYSQAANKCPMAPCVGCENYGDTCVIP